MSSSQVDQPLRWSLLAIVVVHLLVASWHGAAHLQVPVPLTELQKIFVGGVITVMPLVGAALLGTSRLRTAAAVIALSMLGSLIFGVVNHYLLHSPDHVAEVPEHPWRQSFVVSAALVALTEAIGTILGFVALWKWRGRPHIL